MPHLRPSDITSVTAFRAGIREHLTRLKKNGRAEVLTVKGQAEAVVMSPKTFQKLVDDAELGRSVQNIRQSLEQFEQSQGVDAQTVFNELRAKRDATDPPDASSK